MSTLTRPEILDKLNKWAIGEISPVDIHNWAVDLVNGGETEFADWEGDGRFSVAKEAIAELDMLDINLVTNDDVPIFIEFLTTPADQFEAGYIKFIGSLQQINRAARKKTLKKVEPYKIHCKSA